MPNYISSNPSAASARRYLDGNQKELSKAQNQLSSGLLTYDPSELPAASAIGIQFQSDLMVLAQVTSNAVQASAWMQLAAGALQSTSEILTRMNALSAQAANGTMGDNERANLNLEFQSLLAQIDVNANIDWRGVKFFSENAGSQSFQIGINAADALSTLSYTFIDMTAGGGLAIGGSVITDASSASAAAAAIQEAIVTVNAQIAAIGATKIQLGFIEKNLSITSQNLTAAKATFTDTDIPEALERAQKYQALVDVSASVFQKTILKPEQLSRMVESAFR